MKRVLNTHPGDCITATSVFGILFDVSTLFETVNYPSSKNNSGKIEKGNIEDRTTVVTLGAQATV